MTNEEFVNTDNLTIEFDINGQTVSDAEADPPYETVTDLVCALANQNYDGQHFVYVMSKSERYVVQAVVTSEDDGNVYILLD